MTDELNKNVKQGVFILSVLMVTLITAVIGIFFAMLSFNVLAYTMYCITGLVLLLPICKFVHK